MFQFIVKISITCHKYGQGQRDGGEGENQDQGKDQI